MFPHRDEKRGFFTAGSLIQTGRDGALKMNHFLAEAPVGEEELIVIASRTPFTDADEFLKKSLADQPLTEPLETIVAESIRSTEEFIAKGTKRRLNEPAGLGVGVARVRYNVHKK